MKDNNYSVALRAKTLPSFIARLYNVYILLDHAGDEVRANKVYKLQQDTIFDNYADLKVAKNKLKKIML